MQRNATQRNATNAMQCYKIQMLKRKAEEKKKVYGYNVPVATVVPWGYAL